jgi:uncharacterized protein YciI
MGEGAFGDQFGCWVMRKGTVVAKFVAVLEFTDAEELRLQTRPTHREYLRSLFDQGKLVMSGPWADDTGAMLIYEAADMNEAERLLDADPYRTAGVIAEARIKEWRVVVGP